MSAANVVREYGRAMRGDWSEVDGRTVRDDMDLIASWIEGDAGYPGDLVARQGLGVCPFGHGHWSEYCEAECEATS